MRKLLFIVSWFLVSCWMWDLGHVVYYSGRGVLGNGLWNISADLVYHLSWYSSVAAFFVLALYCVKLKERELK